MKYGERARAVCMSLIQPPLSDVSSNGISTVSVARRGYVFSGSSTRNT
jgi:hypothetical protein